MLLEEIISSVNVTDALQAGIDSNIARITGFTDTIDHIFEYRVIVEKEGFLESKSNFGIVTSVKVYQTIMSVP